jgi:hypothetical protein
MHPFNHPKLKTENAFSAKISRGEKSTEKGDFSEHIRPKLR